MQSRIRIVATTAVIVVLLTAVARADQRYTVAGDDRYRVGTTLESTDITYRGTERLSIAHRGTSRRYVSDITYTRSDPSGKAVVHARFVQDMDRDGNFVDRSDEDPDFLTHPQPAVRDPARPRDDARSAAPARDGPVRRGLAAWRSAVARLLALGSGGRLVSGEPAVGVRFEADGPMDGSLPSHPGAVARRNDAHERHRVLRRSRRVCYSNSTRP